MEEVKKQKMGYHSLTFDFVSYNQSFQLRELGFDEICFTHYWGEQFLNENIGGWMKNSNTQYIMAPLKQQVFRWFREKHNLVSWVYIGNVDRYFYTIVENGRFVVDHKVYPTYEEAEDACIDKLIEILKEK